MPLPLASHDMSYVTHSVEGGELFDRIVNVGKFSEDTAKLLFYQMLLAVKVGMAAHMIHVCFAPPLCSICMTGELLIGT